MDNSSETTSTSASPNTNRCDTQQPRLTTSRPNSPQIGLSHSEPYLRFPRPQGNRRLANWVSTSNPDIMHVTTEAEDSCLAESAFELITPIDADFHNDQYTGSVSESVGSLDFHRPDDSHSLAGTEHTCDDESIIDDDVEPLSRSMVQEDAVDVHNGTHAALQEGSEESESEEEARSRCSLEYTQHSLRTPSILTPDASRIIERALGAGEKSDADADALQTSITHGSSQYYDTVSRLWDYAAATLTTALPGFIFAATFTVIISLLYPLQAPFSPSIKPAVAWDIAATTTPVAVYTNSSTATAAPAQQATTSAKGMGLIVITEKTSEEWLFGPKKPNVSFSPLGQGTIMVHVTADAMSVWMKKKNCLAITAERVKRSVKVNYFPSDEGFLVKVPKGERHGVVKVVIQATCRPSIVKAVKVHFGKGMIAEAYEITKGFASNIPGLVPAAAHEAEKCLVEAKRSFCAVSDTLATSVLTASDSLLCRIKNSANKMQEYVGQLPWYLGRSAQDVAGRFSARLESIREQMVVPLKSAHGMKENIQESILNAQVGLITTQISARMWWLSVTGQKDEYSKYGQKAKDYVERIKKKGRDRIRGLSSKHEWKRKPVRCSQRGRCNI